MIFVTLRILTTITNIWIIIFTEAHSYWLRTDSFEIYSITNGRQMDVIHPKSNSRHDRRECLGWGL